MRTCRMCGGSGIQRVSNQRFRTCLACLGQGDLAEIQPSGQDPPSPKLQFNTPADVLLEQLRVLNGSKA